LARKQYQLHRDPKPGRFYILPKIHKVNNPGWPIVSSNNHPTERISQFVDFHLKSLVCTMPSYVKDSTDFLNKLAVFNRLPENTLLVTLDVTHCTLASHLTKEFMLAIISFKNVLVNTSLRKPFATSFV